MSSEARTTPRGAPILPAAPDAPVTMGVHPVGAAPTHAPAATQPVIAARAVGKCYHVYAKPADRLKQAALRWKKRYYREFWALRGVSFQVFPGQSLGILGRNGSGKSTLLQIIAGTLTPTEGEVAVRGRIAAMLELGSGFNPEFTGRENVYLKGAILGISRREMDQRFDDIAAFADIGEFLEQPLKTYSSGMAARLAFAVAFSIDPDVMIVDEILAVGDVGFQQKCLARLRQLRDRGMTLLFVSHSSDAIRSVCQTGLFLDRGQARFFGSAERATDQYLAFVREQTNQEVLRTQDSLSGVVPFQSIVPGQTRYGTGHAQIEIVRVLNDRGEPTRAFALGERVTIEAVLRAHVDLTDLSVSFLVRDFTGVDLMGTTSFDERVPAPPLPKGARARVRFVFENRLRPGNFGISLAVNRLTSRDYSDNLLFDQVDGVAAFVVMADPSRPVHYKFHQPVNVSWEPIA